MIEEVDQLLKVFRKVTGLDLLSLLENPQLECPQVP